MAPCKDCTTKYEGCHGNCEDYILWRKELDSRKESASEYRKRIDMGSYIWNARLKIQKRGKK